jgi:hypothetical protein
MNSLDIIDHHLVIRETVGYEFINKIEIYNLPEVIQFLTVVYNYNRMKDILKPLNQ